MISFNIPCFYHHKTDSKSLVLVGQWIGCVYAKTCCPQYHQTRPKGWSFAVVPRVAQVQTDMRWHSSGCFCKAALVLKWYRIENETTLLQ